MLYPLRMRVAMASVRGILNIQSLNELTYENTPPRAPAGRGRRDATRRARAATRASWPRWGTARGRRGCRLAKGRPEFLSRTDARRPLGLASRLTLRRIGPARPGRWRLGRSPERRSTERLSTERPAPWPPTRPAPARHTHESTCSSIVVKLHPRPASRIPGPTL